MHNPASDVARRRCGAPGFALRFTPAEWKSLLEDRTFLRDADNSYWPRRLMGVPVQIVPDHQICP